MCHVCGEFAPPFIVPPLAGWQGNTIRRGAERPENRVTRFPLGKGGGVSHQRGASSLRVKVQRGVDCPAGNNFIGRFAADPFRLAALATHPLNRGGQGRYGICFCVTRAA